MNVINTNDKFYYSERYGISKYTIKKRLQQIKMLGLKVVGYGEFGIPGVISGLYVERIYTYNEKDRIGYIKWIKEIKNSYIEVKK